MNFYFFGFNYFRQFFEFFLPLPFLPHTDPPRKNNFQKAQSYGHNADIR